jgi:hypothetical protein
MQNIESQLPHERRYWKDHNYNFYTLKNPRYLEALKESERVRQQAREAYGAKMEQVFNSIALIGDPLEKARTSTVDNVGDPLKKAKTSTVDNVGDPLEKAKTSTVDNVGDSLSEIDLSEEDEEINALQKDEDAVQIFVDTVLDKLKETVKLYRKTIEKGVSTSSLTAKLNRNNVYLNGRKLKVEAESVDKIVKHFWIEWENPPGSWRLSDDKVVHLFASENIEKTIKDAGIDISTVQDYAILMKRLGLLDKASLNSAKANFLRDVYMSESTQKRLNASKKKKKKKGKGFTGTGFPEYYTGPDELVDRLTLLIQSIGAGNTSKEIKNEGMAIVTKLQSTGAISRKDFNQLIGNFM